MAHEGIAAGLLVGPSALVCGFRFGWLPAAGLVVVTLLLVLSIVLALIAVYAILIEKVGGKRLKSVLAYVQMLLVCIYLVPMMFRENLLAAVEAMDGLRAARLDAGAADNVVCRIRYSPVGRLGAGRVAECRRFRSKLRRAGMVGA